ncbi:MULTISPECIES: TrbC/VirB2 family protein [Microvirga]|uniref:TrbC/VirB2 family protein n=1 Tax=Microvirga TaxID=186650 RepID=UPI0021C73612|nr:MULTISPECIES: TrbC/VirB2 family protein [unclassified Microvirga]
MRYKTHLAVAACALAVTALMAVDSSASAQVFGALETKGKNAFENIKNLSFLVGGFGIIGLAVMAYFGRFQFKWLFALVGGLALIAASGSMIDYVTQSGSNSEQVSITQTDFGDTLTAR